MRRLLLVATLLITCAGPAWAWNDDAQQCYKATTLDSAPESDEAIAACTRALGSGDLTTTDRAKIFNNRGVVFRRKGEYDRAIADHNEAIRLKPDFAEAFRNRGNAYSGRGEYDRAIADYSEAIRLKPDFVEAYRNRGIAYRTRGEYDRAIADYDEAIRLEPNYASAFKNRGWAYELKGDLRQAERDYRQALSLDPNFTAARHSLNSLEKRLATAEPAPPQPPREVAEMGAERRVALVIGNGAYTNAPALDNPPNDARAVATALRRLGFEVTEAIDLDRSTMEDTLLAFARQAETADDALVFYAGHGIQVDGRNYLLPVDTRLEDERDLRRYPTADQVVVDAAGARRFALVILDACRDNPFTRSLARRMGKRTFTVGRGLAAPGVTPPNTLIAYATAADAVADDAVVAGGKLTSHSPYTMALLQYLEQPGLEVRLLFGKVRDAVAKATRNGQVPYIYGSLGGDEIYLAGAQG